MQSFLDFFRAKERKYFPRRGHWLDVLTSDGAEQAIIQDWCKNTRIPRRFEGQSIYAGLFDLIFNYRGRPPEVAPCEEWEARIILLARSFTFPFFIELTEWETTPSKERSRHMRRVAKLARDLASALEKVPGQYYQPVLELFDEERAVDIIRALPELAAKAFLEGTGYSTDRRTGYQRTDFDPAFLGSNPAIRLGHYFCYPALQELPSILRRQAKLAKEQVKEPKRDFRPRTGNPNARVFARHLAGHFRALFDEVPDEIIVACVCLRFPGMDNPPSKDTVRDWRDTY
jgi:hypothetical protein